MGRSLQGPGSHCLNTCSQGTRTVKKQKLPQGPRSVAAPALAWELLLLQVLRNFARAEASGGLQGKGGRPQPDAGLASDVQGAEGVRIPPAGRLLGTAASTGVQVQELPLRLLPRRASIT